MEFVLYIKIASSSAASSVSSEIFLRNYEEASREHIAQQSRVSYRQKQTYVTLFRDVIAITSQIFDHQQKFNITLLNY